MRVYSFKKIAGFAMMVIGGLGLVLGLFVFLFPLWLLLIYPVITLICAGASLVAFCSHSRSPRLSQVMEVVPRIFLGAATVTAIPLVIGLVSQLVHGGSIVPPHFWDWLSMASLLIPQLLWIPLLRMSPLASFVIALASLGPSIEIWIGGF
jgi:hypothetical protein